MRLPDGVRRLFRMRSRARDIDDEVRHHLDELVREAMARGLSEADARAEARGRFGDLRAYRRDLARIDGRRRPRTEALDVASAIVAMALRGIRRAPGYSLSIVAILGLGLGANGVMFSVVDRLLLRPPEHIVDADEVRRLQVRRRIFNGDVRVGRTLTWPDVTDMERVGAFARVAAFTEPEDAVVGRPPAAGQARVAMASGDFFTLLGAEARLGRFFADEDDRVDAPLVAVVSSEYWERALGGDPGVLGTMLDIGRGRYTVVGVAPPGFTGATLARVDLWLPIRAAKTTEDGSGWEDERGWYWVHAVARLADRITVEAAEIEATAAHRAGRFASIDEGEYDGGAEVLAAPLIAARGPEPSSEARVAGWLGGVSLLVLLIACLNVANLLLARAMRAGRDTAVRLTLGAGRGRLVAEALVQSLVLSVLGGGAALLLAQTLSAVVHRALLPEVAFGDGVVTARMLAFIAVAAVVAAVVTAIAPALQARRGRLGDALRDGGRSVSRGRSRARVMLLVGQAALSVLLLVGAGLFVRSLQNAESQDLGFDADRLAVLRVIWSGSPDAEVREGVYREALARARGVPGVKGAALTYTVPFQSSISLGQPRLPGRDSVPRHRSGGPYVNKVGAGFFSVMGLEIIEGRGIDDGDDRPGAPPVAVVSESMARAIWPNGDAVGSCMILGGDGQPCTEVIGVVENSHRQELVEDDPHFLYFVNQSHPEFLGPPQSMMVRAVDDPEALLPGLHQAVRSVSTSVRFVEARGMRDLVEPEMRAWRLGASMFTLFGVLALVVAAWGLYSVLAFDVVLRHHELGVRSALGAGSGRLVRLVLGQAVGLVGGGVALGLLAAGGAARFIEPLLFRVSAVDPLTYSAVAATLVVTAIVASAFPAWRASRVHPTEALRAD